MKKLSWTYVIQNMLVLYSLVILLLALFFAYYIQRLTQKREGATDMTSSEKGATVTNNDGDGINPQTGLPSGEAAKPPSKEEAAKTSSSASDASKTTASKPGTVYLDPSQTVERDPRFMSMVNTLNISYLKQEMDKLAGIRDRVDKVEKQSNDNSKAIAALGAQYKSTNKEVLGGQDATNKDAVPRVSGLSGDDSTNTNSSSSLFGAGTDTTSSTSKDASKATSKSTGLMGTGNMGTSNMGTSTSDKSKTDASTKSSGMSSFF